MTDTITIDRKVAEQVLEAQEKLLPEHAYQVGDQWLADIHGKTIDVSEYAKQLEAITAFRAALDAAKKVEPALLLDGMTSLQYVSNELYKFQEATGCDTANELPTPQPTERQEPKCHATETLCSTCNNDFRKCVRFHPPQPAPDGWKIVPIVPTEEMINAGMWEDGSHTAKAVWNAMVKAAPKKE